ncbi:hypothetical protein PHYBOEH_000794 [Phytophthora boehmeriae]|uniref:Uncharacterized protein n=1 Tax=Phytophthora boehmeriae TaxID=109152 RepID=A0A8T1WVA8_9STRA|nr:hypothetical protein PHYBOEH_000794 [Phytophthora boehmeriae]
MLTLRLLAARTRLVDVSTTSKCASAIANSLSNNAIQVSSRESLLNPLKSRSLSSVNGPIDQNIEKDDQETMEDETKIQNGQLTSLEQLAQKFQHETDLEDVFEDDWDHTEDHQKKDVYPSKWTSEDTNFARPQHYERRRFDALQSRLARAATNHLRETELDELDFDSELEAVWSPRELKTLPVTDLDKRNQELHAEFLASELDEYADKLERADERRKQKEKK